MRSAAPTIASVSQQFPAGGTNLPAILQSILQTPSYPFQRSPARGTIAVAEFAMAGGSKNQPDEGRIRRDNAVWWPPVQATGHEHPANRSPSLSAHFSNSSGFAGALNSAVARCTRVFMLAWS